MSLVNLPDDILFDEIPKMVSLEGLLAMSVLNKECYQRSSEALANNSQFISYYTQKFLKNSALDIARFRSSVYNTPYTLSIDLDKINFNAIKTVLKKFPKCQQLTVIQPGKLPPKTPLHAAVNWVSFTGHVVGAFCVLVPLCIRQRSMNPPISPAVGQRIENIGTHYHAIQKKLLQNPALEKVASLVSDIQKLHVHISSEKGKGCDVLSLPSLPSLKELVLSCAKDQKVSIPLGADPCFFKKYTSLKSLALNNVGSILFYGDSSGRTFGHFLPSQLEELAISDPHCPHAILPLPGILTTCTNLHSLKIQCNVTVPGVPMTPHTSLKTLEITDEVHWPSHPLALFPQLQKLQIPLWKGLQAEDFELSTSLEHLVLTVKPQQINRDSASFFSDLAAKYPKLDQITLIFEETRTELQRVSGFTITDVRELDDGKQRCLLKRDTA
jgi:hypothetical protein